MTRYISSVNALSGGPKEIFYAIDVAESLAAMHRGGLVHGDIKGANVLTDGRKGFLTDFGLMSRVGRALTYDVGAVGYMAPETLFEPHRHKRVSTQESDMFSFGLLLLGLVDLNKRLSWERSVKDLDQTYGERLRALITTQFEAEDKYRKGLAAITEKERSSGEDLSQSKEQLRVECSRTVNMAGQEKLKLCEEFKRAYRAVHEKLIINVTHSFKPYSLIQELLSIDPKQRPTAEEALKRLNEMYPRSPKAPV